jgi:polyphosphate glucokinase
MQILGIDVGGSGIKGAPVEVATGKLIAPRHRLETPASHRPKDMAETIAAIVKHFRWRGRVGCTFPGVIHGGVVHTAANLDPSWVGVDAEKLLRRATRLRSLVLNDADAAGLAEIHYGASRNRRGVVLMLTLGTGIGSALFLDGRLVPNTEFGHLEMHGSPAEWYAADSARKRKDLRWKEWAERLNEYLAHLELLLSPDLFILGGGVSQKATKFVPRLATRARVVPARLRNEAGIVGAALAAARRR